MKQHGRFMAWALLGWAWPLAVAADVSTVPCEGVLASVQTRQPEAAEIACAGARDAVGFMGRLRLEAPHHVLIELVKQLPPDLRRDAVGCYATQSQRLMVLEMPDFMARKRWLGVPTSAKLYRSVVAHEVAHALVGCHLGARSLASAGHEYLAYVAMFATMDGPTREAVLAAVPGEGFTHDTEINDMRYTLDPLVFGVEAYRHWLRQPDGEQFLRRVIDGQVVPDLLLTRRPEPIRP